MILFSLLFSPSVSELSSNLAPVSILCKTKFLKSFPSQGVKSLPLAYAIKDSGVVYENKDSLAKKQLIKRHFAQKTFNSLYQQTIFLSVSGKRINKYVNRLSSLNINSRKDPYKSLVSKFSKSLFSRSFVLSGVDGYYSSLNSFSSVQYPWNANFFINLSTIFNTRKQQKYSKLTQCLDKIAGLDHYPLFAVSNNLGQLVISETPEGFGLKKSFTDYFSSVNDSSNPQKTWFFVNHKDAEEYMEYVNSHYGLQGTLRIFTCSLATFYELSSRFSNRIEFRLMPDLKEISQLTKVYRYYRNISFHQRQKYSRMSFCGQPLYILKVSGSSKYTNTLFAEKKPQSYSLAFANYETALSVLAKYNRDSLYSNKSFNKPHLIVYNLESLVKDHLEAIEDQKSLFLLVPSRFSYSFVKMTQSRKGNFLADSSFVNYLSSANLWLKRIVWSLTSRQPQG